MLRSLLYLSPPLLTVVLDVGGDALGDGVVGGYQILLGFRGGAGRLTGEERGDVPELVVGGGPSTRRRRSRRRPINPQPSRRRRRLSLSTLYTPPSRCLVFRVRVRDAFSLLPPLTVPVTSSSRESPQNTRVRTLSHDPSWDTRWDTRSTTTVPHTLPVNDPLSNPPSNPLINPRLPQPRYNNVPCALRIRLHT